MHAIILLLITIQTIMCVAATVEEALQEWKPKVSPSMSALKSYKEGFNVGIEIGKNLNKDEAIAVLNPWVFFKGAKENQKNCTLDATVNNAIESIIKNVAQSALIGRWRDQIGDVINKQIDTRAETYITGPAKKAYQYATEKASEVKEGVTSTLSGAWKWLTGSE